jgi:AcrR family transcriptional regulator
MTAGSGLTLRERAARYSGAQRRTIDAALELFADHGVAGTSFQMVADAVGVSKAAIYHQFRSKNAIVLAVLEVQLQPLEAALDEAERNGGTLQARETLLARIIDSVVGNRRALSTLQRDPVLFRLIEREDLSRGLFARIFAMLLGDDAGDDTRVRAAVLSAAIGAAAHPFVADLDDQTLRDDLLDLTRKLIFKPG